MSITTQRPKISYCLYSQAANSIGSGKESERSMVMTKTMLSDIPSSHENLMTWAYDHGYRPVTSYTKAPVANRFHLRLEDPGKEEDSFCIKHNNIL